MANKKQDKPAANRSKNKSSETHIITRSVPVSDQFEEWFLDYASYVILERAVPHVYDGLKPVQRRILHALREMDDGRFHKVANVIGQTMQYHPHGDASIGDALVNLGQKELMVDTQGNWGDNRTGDRAAAPRYIEARLSKFALEVAFNPKTTDWQTSYDGRKKEPITLPLKFPLLLAQGVEGIAVGLATKILPHNFIELCGQSIKILEGKTTKIYPDFPNGGIADASDYKRGKRGGKVRVRANVELIDKKILVIKDIPYGVTTTNLIDSIIKANDKGKIKIKKVTDNTAADVEILVEIASGVSPEVTLDALYAFTNCEVSISPNACVILDDKPHFFTVDEILEVCTQQTREMLRLELEIRKHELEEKWHFASLEKIFIENRIYRDIEECETWEAVIEAIDVGLKPHVKKLHRAVTTDDIVRLTEIRIKRISKFDSFKADEILLKLEEELEEIKNYLNNLTDYAIAWYQNLMDKYGKGRERKTKLKSFDTVKAKAVAAANARLYVNRKDGFIGFGMRRDEFITECSDIDDIIVIRKDGYMRVTRISDKKFVGKDILHVGVWKKSDERMTYNLVYADIEAGKNYGKRFNVTSITRDKDYSLGGKGKMKVLYLSSNPNGEAEVVSVQLSQGVKARTKQFDFDFTELSVKGRTSKGNIVSRYSIRKITQKEVGQSTLGGREIWFDDSVGRLNVEQRGRLLGSFDSGDMISVIFKNGSYELSSFELSNRYEMDKILMLDQYDPETVFSVAHQDGKSKIWYLKRFCIEASGAGKNFSFINEEPGSKLGFLSTEDELEITFATKKKGEFYDTNVLVHEFIDIKGWKAQGNKLTGDGIIGKIKQLESEEEETVKEPENTVSEGDQVEWDVEEGTREKKSDSDSEDEPDKGKKDQGKLF
ncbi:MAG: topoisomerase-4 subunit A [Limisphaerales bacterium]|jgi:topoisomerase-4 subunit A